MSRAPLRVLAAGVGLAAVAGLAGCGDGSGAPIASSVPGMPLPSPVAVTEPYAAPGAVPPAPAAPTTTTPRPTPRSTRSATPTRRSTAPTLPARPATPATPVPPAAPSPVGSAAGIGSPAVGGPPQAGVTPAAVGLGRPMTPWQKLYRQECEQNIVRDGCQFFTDQSLRLQGINPES